MKKIASTILVFGVILLLFSCDSHDTLEESKKVMDEADVEKIPSDTEIDTAQTTIFHDYQVGSCENLLLEITRDQSGMILPKGKLLEIRITRSGKAEYDLYENSNFGLRHSFSLSGSQLHEFYRLMSSNSILNAKNTYTLENVCVDTRLIKEITFCPVSTGRMKRIIVKECGAGNIEEFEKLPTAISSLFQKVDNLIKRNSSENVE